MSSILIHILTATMLAIPPLTPAQQAQVNDATDGPGFGEGALFPLLENAMTWQVGDESGATVPDYVAVRENPDAYRGQLFLIEGVFAGVPTLRGTKGLKVGELSRPGPWDGKLEQWMIGVDLPSGERDWIAVYLVNPPPNTPRASQRVRLAARFYKIWHERRAFIDTDVEQQPEDDELPMEQFLVFIGHGARVTGGASAGGEPAERTLPWVLAIAVGALLVFWWRLRASLKVRPTAAQLRRLHREEQRQGDSEPSDPTPYDDDDPLPEDPIEAMEEMERRRRAVGNGEEPSPELEELRAAVKTRRRDADEGP